MKKLSAFFTAIVAVMAFHPLQANADVAATSVEILRSNKPVTEGKLAVGGSVTLAVKILPEEAAGNPVIWTISNSEVAILDAKTAKIRGMVPGVTTVTAQVDDVKATYTLTVQQKAAKVGNYFFSDNTWETGGIVTGKTCIGVIFYVNEDGQSGKIVSLDEAPTLKWSSAEADSPGATDMLDGMANLNKIKAIPDWENSFDAEAWCVGKNVNGIEWYLPAVDELRQLFAASCGLQWVLTGADTSKGQINNWTGNSVTMLPGDETNPYPEARAAFNAIFTKIGSTALAADKYWSSTQEGTDFAQFLSFEGGYSNLQPKQYFHVCRTRAIAQFKERTPIQAGVGNIVADKLSSLSVTVNAGTANVEAPSEIVALSIFALSGRRIGVPAEITGNAAAVDISTLSTGAYILTVTGADGARRSVRLLKR